MAKTVLKVAFFVHTSGQAYLWGQIGKALEHRGHKTIFVIREHASICLLLDNHSIQYFTYGKASKTKYGKVLQLPVQLLSSFSLMKKFRPDILVGFGPIEACMGTVLGKPSIIFDDNESRSPFDRLSWQYSASTILTPACFCKDLGKKQIRFNGYKELAYLRPSHFKPDHSIYTELGITDIEKYIILRFGSFEAVHDANRKGFSECDKYQLVDELSKYARVFISAEGKLPADLMQYKLPTPNDRIHHVLYFAHLLVGDTGTMACEAAVLGTPAVICASFTPHFGNFIELEQEYGLLYCFQQSDKALVKAVALIQQPDLKDQWVIKRNRLLNDKIDVTKFFTNFIENYQQPHNQSRKTWEV